jgi:hypothetical protein
MFRASIQARQTSDQPIRGATLPRNLNGGELRNTADDGLCTERVKGDEV